MKNMTHSFTLLMDDRVHAALSDCAKLTELSKGLICRYAITYYHAMVVAALPTCANGQQCFCPQMHQRILPNGAHPSHSHPHPPPYFPAPPNPLTPTPNPDADAAPK